MRQNAVARSEIWLAVLLLLMMPLFLRADQQETENATIRRFRELYGAARNYKWFSQQTLNGHGYILAFWYEEDSPVELRVSIFRHADDRLQEPVTEAFTGAVAEEIIRVTTFDLKGDGRDELIFLSNSGQIKLIRVLEESGPRLKLIFDNGGTDVTLMKDTREVCDKSKTAQVVEVNSGGPPKTRSLH